MKKYFTLFLLTFSAALFGQIPSVGLIGGWPFTGNANDMSGMGNNGTVFGAVLTTDRFGAANCAYNFNGTNNYIDMLTAGPTGTVSRSVSFWERTTYTANVTCGFTYGLPGSGGSWQINFNYNCQAVGFDNSSSAVMHGNSIVNNNQWHHIVAIMNSTVGIMTGNVQIYIDGVLQPAVSCAVSGTNSPINTNSTMPIRIGYDNTVRYFKGDLDDFYMYNRALTPTEVLQLYNYSPCTAAPPDPSPVSGVNTICQGSSTIYSVAPVSGATSYTWTLPGGWTGVSNTNTILATSGPNSGSISVVAGNPCGNSQPSSTNVVVNPVPTVSVAADKFIICKGNNTNLYASGATSYTWNTSATNPSISISPTVTTSYSVIGTNSFGCQNSSVVTVTNNPLPTISVNGPSITCAGQSINLASNGASTYTWQPGNLNGFFVSVSPTVTTNYTVTGTDGNGCVNFTVYSQSVSACAGINQLSIDQTETVVYPNPFTTSILITNLYSRSVLEVYNALGALVYSGSFEKEKIQIDLSAKDKGIYFVRIKNSSGIITRKIVKE